MNYRTLLSLFLFVSGALAAFTQQTCTSKNECAVQQGSRYCYDPKQSNRTRQVSCTEEHFDVSKIMIRHINEKSSINYYDLYNWDHLGDYTYLVTKPAYWCLSGKMTDGTYQSMCGYTSRDNRIENIYCTLGIGQPYVEDGCYTPDTSDAAIQYAHLLDAIGGSSATVASTPTTGPSRNNASCLSIPAMGILLLLVGLLSQVL